MQTTGLTQNTVFEKWLAEMERLVVPHYPSYNHSVFKLIVCLYYVNKFKFPPLQSKGSDTNPFEIKPSYTFWAPHIGPNCKKGANPVNSKFHKADHKEDLETLGARPEHLTIEKLMGLVSERVCFFVEFVTGTILCSFCCICYRFRFAGAEMARTH